MELIQSRRAVRRAAIAGPLILVGLFASAVAVSAAVPTTLTLIKEAAVDLAAGNGSEAATIIIEDGFANDANVLGQMVLRSQL